MELKLRHLLLILPLLLLAGCSKNVFYYKEAVTQSQTYPDHYDVYIDAFGHLYPSDDFLKDVDSEEQEDANLYKLYESKQVDCDSAPEKSESSSLCEARTNLDAWRNTQAIMWKSRADSVFERIKNTNKELVVLVHGFNNNHEEITANYELMRNRVQQSAQPTSREFFFLHVFWDGFKDMPGAWGLAQSSGPLAGLHLRQFMNYLTDNFENNGMDLPDIKFLTHSSGAFVVGAILGNPYYALPRLKKGKHKGESYSNFYNLRKMQDADNRSRIPEFKSIKVGMFAAATPTTTFISKDDIEGQDTFEPNAGLLAKNVTLLFSINPNDWALSKVVGLTNLSTFGATGSGADKDCFCDYLNKLPNAYGKEGVVNRVDAIKFSDPDAAFYDFWDNHSLSDSDDWGTGYFNIKPPADLFFEAFLNDNYADPNGHYVQCPDKT